MYHNAHESEPWFHKGISAHDAIDILEKEPNGSFLFRPSSSPGYLSLSYKGVKGDDSIHHIRVQIVGTSYVTDGDVKQYASLSLLVKARNSILMNPIYDKSKTVPPGFPNNMNAAPAVGMGMGAMGMGVGRGPARGPARNNNAMRPARAPPARQPARQPARAQTPARARPLPSGAPPTSTPVAASPEFDENAYTQLMDMGFTRDESTNALRTAKGNIEAALDLLMGGGGGEVVAQASAPAALTAAGPKPSGVVVVAQGDGSSRMQHIGPASSRGLHGPWGVTDDQNLAHKNYMEDGFVCVPDLDASAPYAYFAVYDGHSGREATVFAQDNLHLNLLAALRAGQTPEAAHAHAYQLTDQELLSAGIKTAGCTVVSALFSKEGNQRVLHIANAGDGRAVLCRAGQAVRMSFDHKVEVESETKRILALGGTILWGRVQGQTMVSRSLGDHDLKKYVISEPYYHKEILDPTCEFLIVACDGIWDVASDQEAVDLYGDAKAQSAALIKFVIEKGTKDNLTAMIIRL
eukprot:CAMPEP_0168582252 /NCGR_PEP_ID=MMETSP0420-20121227/1873_1 /TAXON_ID=498008 /ORGANISM="Pessonella sp." /LENGTH=520 /DNA_ID=CAMNT_0008616707 /DNA_START=34 /DNA_END=1594 /DNA_ORIENTATION=-